jgi:hypothetical protein
MRSDLLQLLSVAVTLVAACSEPLPPAGAVPANLSVAPNVGYSGDALAVVISGTGFLAKVTQPQGGGAPVLDTQTRAWLGSTELNGVTWLGTTTLNATVPPGLAPGTYDLTVENALGNQGTAVGAYTVLATPFFSATATVDHAAVDVGQTLTLTVIVTNGSSSPITGFQLGVPTVSSSDGGSAGPPSAQPAAPSSIAAGEKLSFTWTYVPTTPGMVSITVEITGVASGAAVTAALAAPAEALIQLPAALTPSWAGPPSGQTVNFPVSLTLELANSAGAAPAVVTTVTPSMSPASSVSCTAVDPAPSAALPVRIAGSASQQFTWSCTATTSGDYLFGASVVASDLNTGAPLSVLPTAVTVRYATSVVLTVVPAGTGSGTVTSSPAGISACPSTGGTCSAPFRSGTLVTLTAAPANGSTVSWAGCTPTAGTPTQCTVTMDHAKSVTATFTLARVTLTITPPTNGTITCGGGCAPSYGYGATVTLTATPNAGYSFSSWTGACSGTTTATCTMSMTGAMTVGATFNASAQPLRISASPAAGTTGFRCNSVACQSGYATGTALTITAPAAPGYTFTGWSGGTCSGKGACSFRMPGGGATVIASFKGAAQPLKVSASPAAGTTGLRCNSVVCQSSYATGTVLTITAPPARGYTFTGWAGGTCSGNGACSFTMPAGGATVIASFH